MFEKFFKKKKKAGEKKTVYVAWQSSQLGIATVFQKSTDLKAIFDHIISVFQREGAVILIDPTKDGIAENTVFGRALWDSYSFDVVRFFFEENEDGCPQWTFFICKKTEHKCEVPGLPTGKIIQTNGCTAEFKVPDHVVQRIRVIRCDYESDEGNA